MINQPFTARVLLCLMVIAVSVLAVQGQSGRRQNNPPPAAPIPTPTPEPTPTPKNEQKEPDLGFLVGVDSGPLAMFPVGYTDAVLLGCAEALRDGSSAHVDPSPRDMSRGEAIKKAKAEKNSYVVLLTLAQRTMGPNTVDLENIEVQFVVFAPTTAKIVASGTSYPYEKRKGPFGVGLPPGDSRLYREQLLKRAGEDAGERILKSLHLNTPSRF